MAVTIRLSRGGHNNYDVFRISVADSRKASTGKFLQQIGHYDPNHQPPTVKIDEVSAVNWLLKGARLSDTVASLFRRYGILDKFQKVKSGTPLEEVAASVREWKLPGKKLSKKAAAKETAKKEAEANKAEAAKAEEVKAQAPAESSVPEAAPEAPAA